jgi:hypothetical protein
MMMAAARIKMACEFCRIFFLFALAIGVALGIRADTNAVTPLNYAFGFRGYDYGAVGFSFTPSTNLAVTRVSYYDTGEAAPIISFWSSTNYVFASFQLAPGTGSYVMVYSNVSLQLLAGQLYAITLQDGTNMVLFNAFTHLQTAPQVSNYAAQIYVFSTGGFTDYGTNYYFEGPDFSYNNLIGPVTTPVLQIAGASYTNAVVSWPAAPAGFILQQNSTLNSTNWMAVTNAVVTGTGTNQVSSPSSGINFFRLLHP